MNNSMSVEYIDHMGNDLSVVRAARVSFAADAGEEWRQEDSKLISYLARHNHWTPFAHTAITIRMKAPIPIRTQCFKHKQGFVENEESRRYISTKPEYYMPVFREAVTNKKQGSGEPVENSNIASWYDNVMSNAVSDYEELLASGVCEEQARFVLPQGMMVNWYWTGSLAAFARFVALRSDSHAQVEIQELANMVSDIIQPLFPVSWKALTNEDNKTT